MLRIVSAAFIIMASVISSFSWCQTTATLTPAAPYLLGASPKSSIGRATVDAKTSRAYLEAMSSTEGYHLLSSNWGMPGYSRLLMLVKSDLVINNRSIGFIRALEDEKQNLMSLFSLTNQEYNRLAVLAFGILGNESKFYMSVKYNVKETAPFAVTGLKIAKEIMEIMKDVDFEDVKTGNIPEIKTSTNSRGPTQMKRIPDRIVNFYSPYGTYGDEAKKKGWFACNEPKLLQKPHCAAVATLGFLAEALVQTRRMAKNHQLTHINETNVYDYVPYIYFGQAKRLYSSDPQLRATPSSNAYIRKLKSNIQLLELYEQ